MDTAPDQYRISSWLAEFSDPKVEEAFQKHMQPILIRQLRGVLLVWGALLLLFAVPDYIAIGATAPFFYLLAYRVAIVAALATLYFSITPQTEVFRISLPVTLVIMASFSGFMLFFVYRDDAVNLVIGVLMLQLMAALMFAPVRFIMLLCCAGYAVVLTLLTRLVLGSTTGNLIALFVLLMLPVVVGGGTAMRLNILQRRQFALLSRTESINLELESEMKHRLQLEATPRQLAAADIDVEAATVRITATIGVTCLIDGDQDVEAVIRRADAALYRGKDAGRNRVEMEMGLHLPAAL